HRGFEQIVKHAPAPILPVCLEQVWGSIFSYWGGKLIWKWPHELPYPVTVAFGKPMPAESHAHEVRLAVQKLSADGAIERSGRERPVHRQFVRMASRHPLRTCIIDAAYRKKPLNYGEVLISAICLSRRLRRRLGDSAMVGVWLPPGAPAAFANIALALLGKTSVNLNYTASAAVVQSAVKQCNLRHIITSKRFVHRVPLDAGPGVESILMEEVAAEIGWWPKFRAAMSVTLL